MNIFDQKTEQAAFTAGIGIIIVSAFFMFGLTGAKTVSAFIIFSFPFYMILSNFSLKEDEKIFFAFFGGLSYFALAVWLIDRISPSLKLSIISALIILTVLGLFWKKLRLPTDEKK